MLVKKERRRVSGGDGGTDMNERLAAVILRQARSCTGATGSASA